MSSRRKFWDAKADANQVEITTALRSAGFSVLLIHRLGQGAPDVLVGGPAGNVLLELKDGQKVPSKRCLTPAEQRFFDDWQGPIAVAESAKQALDIARLYCSLV